MVYSILVPGTDVVFEFGREVAVGEVEMGQVDGHEMRRDETRQGQGRSVHTTTYYCVIVFVVLNREGHVRTGAE